LGKAHGRWQRHFHRLTTGDSGNPGNRQPNCPSGEWVFGLARMDTSAFWRDDNENLALKHFY
jgi:hypothetical protein